MKKTKIFVLTVAMTLGISVKASAFPANKEVLVIGNRAYDLNSGSDMIISSRFNDSDFLNYLANNSDNIYYLVTDDDGNATTLTDVFGEQTITEPELISKVGGRISYYSGTETSVDDYWVSENGQYKDSTQQNTNASTNKYVTLQIEPKQVKGNLYIFKFKINNLVGVPGGEYFSVGSSSISKTTGAVTCMVDVSTIQNGDTLPIYVYSSDMKTKIASATLKESDITDSNGEMITSSTIRTIKFSSATNPIDIAESKYTVLGNMSNGGLLDSDDNYIYYVNTGDSNKIYKKNTYGTENIPITNDKAGYIYVYGSWVYYCNYSDGGKIYKVKTDGTRRQKISDDKGTYLNVIDDKVYYVNASDGNKIYCLDSAGNSTKLSDDEATFLNIGTSDNLFYSNKSEGKNLYKIDTDGNREKVDDLGTSNVANYINISTNSTVAYYSSSDGYVYRSGDPYNEIKIRIQTTNGLVYDKVSNINIADGTIYYKSLTNGGKLYMVGTSGGVAEQLTTEAVDGIFVYCDEDGNDDVYYTKNGKLFFLSSDTISSGTATKGTAVAKSKVTTKITKMDSIDTIYTDSSDSADTIDEVDVLKYLPETVTAVMSDGSIEQQPVSWDTASPKSKNGIYTYTGTVVGYGNKVTANLAIGSQTGMSTKNTYASNEIGKNDTVVVEAGTLTKGDVVKVYDSSTSKLLKSGTVDATGGVVISGLNFGTYAGSVKVTVTTSGKAESQPISVSYGPEREEAPIITDSNLEDTTLTVSGDYIIIDGIELTLTGNEQIYVGSKTDTVQASNDEQNWVKVTSPGAYGSWNSSTKVLTLSGSVVTKALAKDLQTDGDGKEIFIRTAGSPASTPAVFVVNPRIAAPSSVTFDETYGLIRGTTTKEEYSLDGGTTWKDCTAGTTSIGTFPNTSVRVRLKATKSTLASLEALQVKLTDLAGENESLAITKSATVDSSDGDVTNGIVTLNSSGNATGSTLNTIVLKSSVAVTWKVVDEDGSSTDLASIKSVGKDNKTALLTGYENGVVKVIATTTDGNSMQGEINVNITNQPIVTVKNSTEFKNAVNSGARIIKLLGIGGSYYFDTLPTPNNDNNDLTIIGQDQTSVINITNTSGGTFANVNGYKLNLKNLTLKGSTNSNLANVIKVVSGSVNIDEVYFDSIQSSSNNAVGINHTGGTLTVNESRFLTSNSFVTAIKTTDGTITDNSFVGNGSFTGEKGAIYASDAAKIQGNTFKNYLGNTDEYAISATDDSAVIGGVAKDLWNAISNSDIGIKLNGSGISTSDLETNNSIDIKNTTTPIEE